MRYLRLPVLLLMLSLELILPGPGASPVTGAEIDRDLEDFLHRVELNSASVKSFSCDFVQTRYLTVFPKPVQFAGHLSLARPDRLRWEFREPLPSVLVLNGKNGLKCSDEGPVREFSLDVDPVMRLLAVQLWAWTSGSYRDLQKDFTFELLPGPVLVFVPRTDGAGSFVSKIKVVFDPDFLQPLAVEISEPGGDHTRISFAGYQRNIDFPANLFTECRPR